MESSPQTELKGSAGQVEQHPSGLVEKLLPVVQYLAVAVSEDSAGSAKTDLPGSETEYLAVVVVMGWVARFGENLLEPGKRDLAEVELWGSIEPGLEGLAALVREILKNPVGLIQAALRPGSGSPAQVKALQAVQSGAQRSRRGSKMSQSTLRRLHGKLARQYPP